MVLSVERFLQSLRFYMSVVCTVGLFSRCCCSTYHNVVNGLLWLVLIEAERWSDAFVVERFVLFKLNLLLPVHACVLINFFTSIPQIWLVCFDKTLTWYCSRHLGDD